MKHICSLFLFVWLLSTLPVYAQSIPNNSNLWTVHRDNQVLFCISYPPDWIIVQPRGRNVRFSVNPPDGAGNCNIVVSPNKEIIGMTQEQLNREIETLPQSQTGWAGYINLPISQVRVIESRIARIGGIPALLGVIETKLENLEGKYTRYQIVVVTLKPGEIWSLNCGASSFKEDEAKARFNFLRPTFDKILGSFMFMK
jgi:hypothetical protein